MVCNARAAALPGVVLPGKQAGVAQMLAGLRGGRKFRWVEPGGAAAVEREVGEGEGASRGTAG